MGVYHDFDDVDAFTVGAVGRPGQRTFLIQARRGRERVTVKCEKQQAAAIAEYLRTVLNDLPPADDRPMPSALELAGPVDVAFVLGPVGLGYERSNDRVLVQLDEIVPVDDDGEPDPEALEDRSRMRVFLTRGQVEAFCEQADQLVAAGRPPCRWCSLPIDPDGHICPRMN
ncbi:MAG: DUF3090 domain-containing protein [Ilumatobacteraceae bacterium]|jgi:uncharacterized repeat protein (TIGR03847 family)